MRVRLTRDVPVAMRNPPKKGEEFDTQPGMDSDRGVWLEKGGERFLALFREYERVGNLDVEQIKAQARIDCICDHPCMESGNGPCHTADNCPEVRKALAAVGIKEG